jgi:alpha-beta hydrolase superfamily lysophospholipase
MVPNDILGNLNVMGGDSALQRLVSEALDREIAKEIATHPNADYGVGGYPVMLAGFSQGGITAASFAESNTRFHIVQVVTVASPVGDFTQIPEKVNVLAFEAPGDVVPTFDGTPNPTTANWETIRHDNTGGAGSHNALLYSAMAATDPAQPTHVNNVGTFIGTGKSPVAVDYYGRKAP